MHLILFKMFSLTKTFSSPSMYSRQVSYRNINNPKRRKSKSNRERKPDSAKPGYGWSNTIIIFNHFYHDTSVCECGCRYTQPSVLNRKQMSDNKQHFSSHGSVSVLINPSLCLSCENKQSCSHRRRIAGRRVEMNNDPLDVFFMLRAANLYRASVSVPTDVFSRKRT